MNLVAVHFYFYENSNGARGVRVDGIFSSVKGSKLFFFVWSSSAEFCRFRGGTTEDQPPLMFCSFVILPVCTRFSFIPSVSFLLKQLIFILHIVVETRTTHALRLCSRPSLPLRQFWH
jgi:uncharacterized membrane protein